MTGLKEKVCLCFNFFFYIQNQLLILYCSFFIYKQFKYGYNVAIIIRKSKYDSNFSIWLINWFYKTFFRYSFLFYGLFVLVATITNHKLYLKTNCDMNALIPFTAVVRSSR